MNTIKQTLLREIEANAAWCMPSPYWPKPTLPAPRIERDFVARWCFSAGTGAEFVGEIARKAWGFVLAHGEEVACCV